MITKYKKKQKKTKKIIYSCIACFTLVAIAITTLLVLLFGHNNNSNNNDHPIYINEATISNKKYAVDLNTPLYLDNSDNPKASNTILLDCQKISDDYDKSTNFIIDDENPITYGFLIPPTMNFYLSAINDSSCRITINASNAISLATPFFAFAIGSLSPFDGVFRGEIHIDKSVNVTINNSNDDSPFIYSGLYCLFYFNSIGMYSSIQIDGSFRIYSLSMLVFGIYVADTIENDSTQIINGYFSCVTVNLDEIQSTSNQTGDDFLSNNYASCMFVSKTFGSTYVNGVFYTRAREASSIVVQNMGTTAILKTNGIFTVQSFGFDNATGISLGDYANANNILNGQIVLEGIFSIKCNDDPSDFSSHSSAINIINRTSKGWHLIINISLTLEGYSCAVVFFDSFSEGYVGGQVEINGRFTINTTSTEVNCSIIVFEDDASIEWNVHLYISMTSSDTKVLTNARGNGSTFLSFIDNKNATYLWNNDTISEETKDVPVFSTPQILMFDYYSDDLASINDFYITCIYLAIYGAIPGSYEVSETDTDTALANAELKNNVRYVILTYYLDFLNAYILNSFVSTVEKQEIEIIINRLYSNLPHSKYVYIDQETIKDERFCIHAGSQIHVGGGATITTANDLLDLQAVADAEPSEMGIFNFVIVSNIDYGLLVSPTENIDISTNASNISPSKTCDLNIKNDRSDTVAMGIVVGMKDTDFIDPYSGTYFMIDKDFECNIVAQRSASYGIYVKSIDSNTHMNISKSSFSIYSKYNNAYGLYIGTCKSTSLNISGLWVVQSEIYKAYGCYIDSILTGGLDSRPTLNIFCFFSISANSNAYGLYFANSSTNAIISINNSTFMIAAKKVVCAIYVGSKVDNIIIESCYGSLIGIGIDTTIVSLSILTYNNGSLIKGLCFENNHFALFCDPYHGTTSSILISNHNVSFNENNNYVDLNKTVATNNDSSQLDNFAFYYSNEENSSLWNWDTYNDQPTRPVACFPLQTNITTIQIRPSYKANFFVAPIVTCGSHNYQISTEYNSSYFTRLIFDPYNASARRYFFSMGSWKSIEALILIFYQTSIQQYPWF